MTEASFAGAYAAAYQRAVEESHALLHVEVFAFDRWMSPRYPFTFAPLAAPNPFTADLDALWFQYLTAATAAEGARDRRRTEEIIVARNAGVDEDERNP